MTYSFTIKNTHPSLKGHFPGNPVVPGVIILDEVMQIIKSIKPDFLVKTIPAVKFTQPLLAEQRVNVEIIHKTDTSISFNCLHNENKIASGQFALKSSS